jgi:hypothetical protein
MTSVEAQARASWRAARRAYEIGRLRTGAARAVVVAVVIGALGVSVTGSRALAWVALPWLAWTVIEWRGGALRTGGMRGLVAGGVTLLLPLTWLRPCCGPGMQMGEGACCAQPGTCSAAGAVIGLVAALAIPSVRSGKRLEAAAGAALAIAPCLLIRCAALVVGEGVGLAAGVLAGVAAASLAKAWIGIASVKPHGR